MQAGLCPAWFGVSIAGRNKQSSLIAGKGEKAVGRIAILVTAALLLPLNPAQAQKRVWRTYVGNPSSKVSVCYPGDLLVPYRNRKHHEIDLASPAGPNEGEAILFGRPDKRADRGTTVQDELEYALNQEKMTHSRILHKEFTPESYFYISKADGSLTYAWGVHVDRSVKQLLVTYPAARAAQWKGIPERMRACFRSLGPITDPLAY